MIGLLAAVAGSVGALARFGADGSLRTRWPGQYPWQTLAINVSGSLLLGFLTGLVLFHGASSDVKTVLGTGFCGGYTTFSTASFESVRLLQERRWATATAIIGGNAVLTLAAAALGLALAYL